MLELSSHRLPDGRRCLRRWSKTLSRCPSTDTANATLTAYGFRQTSAFRRRGDIFQNDALPDDVAAWTHSIYAFVINDEIMRIGSSQGTLKARMKGWSDDVSAAFKGHYRPTTAEEASLWADELLTHGEGTIWARQGSLFRSTIADFAISGFREEEYHLIRKHSPRLNRSAR